MNLFRAALPCLALLASLPAAAQQPSLTASAEAPAEGPRVETQPYGKAFWGGLGFAIGTPGIGLQVDATLRNEDRVIRGRYLMMAGAREDLRTIFISEVAAMYGIGTRYGRSANWYSAAAGLALLTGERGDETFTTIGVPVELQVISRRAPHLGFTLTSNLNPELPYVAGTLSLQIGRVP